MNKDWNPRYVAFALAHGKSPMQQMIDDEKRWPGGVMCGFILWMSKAEKLFKKQQPSAFIGPHISNQDAWTEFVEGLGVERNLLGYNPPTLARLNHETHRHEPLS